MGFRVLVVAALTVAVVAAMDAPAGKQKNKQKNRSAHRLKVKPDDWQERKGESFPGRSNVKVKNSGPSVNNTEREGRQGYYDYCYDWEFECDDGYCISEYEQCDGYEDCSYGEDEDNCQVRECGEDEYKCTSGYDGQPFDPCIPVDWVCDEFSDCIEGDDEENCEQCLDDEFRCDSRECVSLMAICNGTEECIDGSDERQNCPKCEEGWEMFLGYTCFDFSVKRPATHTAASTACQDVGASLARPKTRKELEWVVSQMRKQNWWFWIDAELQWRWGDQYLLNTTQFADFKPAPKPTNKCVSVRKTKEGTWNWKESKCDSRRKAKVICEKFASLSN